MFRDLFGNTILDEVVLSGSYASRELIKWACDEGFEWTESKSNSAAYNGQLSRLTYFRNKLPMSSDLCRHAASNGQIPTLKALKKWGMPMDTSTTKAAYKGEHWDTLKWLIQKGCPYDHMKIRYGIPNSLFQWLQCFEHGIPNFNTEEYQNEVEYYDCVDEFDDDL